MKKLSNFGGYHRLALFVIHTFTCSHLEDEEMDWLKLGRLCDWKVVRIDLGQVLKVQFSHATTALFTSFFGNLVNSANAHHDLGTMLLCMLMIVEMFVIVVITFHHCYDRHYLFSEMYFYVHDILGVTPVFRVRVVSVNIWMFNSNLIWLGQVFSFTFWSLYDMQADPLPSEHKSQVPGHPNNQILYSGI